MKQSLKEIFNKLSNTKKISFLAWVWKTYPYKMDYARMCPSLRKFHDPKAKR